MKMRNLIGSLSVALAFTVGTVGLIGCDNKPKTSSDKVSDAAHDAKNDVKDAAHDVKNDVKDAAHDTKNAVKDAANETADKARDATK